MPYATADDVRVYAPDLEDDAEELAKVDTLLEQAEDLVVLEFPNLDADVASGAIPIIRIVRVESEMVAAVMNNPRARQSESQTVGGLSTSHTVNTAVASGLLNLTDRHRQLLAGGTSSSSNGMGVIAPVLGWSADSVPLLPDYRAQPHYLDRW